MLFTALKGVVPWSVTSFKRQWRTSVFLIAKVSRKVTPKAMLERPLAGLCKNLKECNLLIIYSAFTQVIVCSRDVVNQSKLPHKATSKVILVNFRKLFGSHSCLLSSRSDLCCTLPCSWDENDSFYEMKRESSYWWNSRSLCQWI